MEKTLTRLRSNLKSRRKLSLPMLVGVWTPPSPEVATPATPSTPVDAVEDVDKRPRSWLSMSRSRTKNRNKPRRWPSTPAIVANGGDAVDAADSNIAISQSIQVLVFSLLEDSFEILLRFLGMGWISWEILMIFFFSELFLIRIILKILSRFFRDSSDFFFSELF